MAFKYAMTQALGFGVLQSRENGLKTEKVWDLLCFIQMRGFGFSIALTKQQPHTVYCIYAPLNAEHEYAYDAGAIVVYLRGMKNRQISHLKKTIITPFRASLQQLPDRGAVCYKRKKALDVCIVKGTVATRCRRFAYLSTTKLIRYRSRSKFFAKNFQSLPRWRIPPSSVRLFAHQQGLFSLAGILRLILSEKAWIW